MKWIVTKKWTVDAENEENALNETRNIFCRDVTIEKEWNV